MLSRQVLDNGKVTSLTKCKHFGFVQRKQNASAMEHGQQTNCQRTKKAKSCVVCPVTFKMSGSSAIRPLADRPFVVGPGFSPIPGKLVSQILRGTFVDLSDLWSANLVSSDPEPHLMLDGRLVLTVPPKKQRRQIEDITSWTEAFTVFSLVLMSSFPQRWKDLTLYKLLILRIHRQFSGRMWLAYDKAFGGHAAAIGLFDWSLMNTQLFNFHAARASLHSSSPSSESSRSHPAPLHLGSVAFCGTMAAAPPLSRAAAATTIPAGVVDCIVLSHTPRDRSREWTKLANVVPGPRRLFLPPSATWGVLRKIVA